MFHSDNLVFVLFKTNSNKNIFLHHCRSFLKEESVKRGRTFLEEQWLNQYPQVSLCIKLCHGIISLKYNFYKVQKDRTWILWVIILIYFFQDIPKQYNAYDCGMFVCMVSLDHYVDCIGTTQKLIEGHNEIKLLFFTLLVCWILEQRGSPHI